MSKTRRKMFRPVWVVFDADGKPVASSSKAPDRFTALGYELANYRVQKFDSAADAPKIVSHH